MKFQINDIKYDAYVYVYSIKICFYVSMIFNHWLSGKLWYIQHICVGDIIDYTEASSIMVDEISSYLTALIMTSSNGNILHITGHLRREFTGHRWIPRTKASDAELWWLF